MAFRRLFMVAGCSLFALLSCGSKTTHFDSVSVRGPMPEHQRSENVNAFAAGGELMQLRNRALAFSVGSVRAAEQPPSLSVEPRSVVVSTPMVATTAEPTSSIDWDCVAVAETGANWQMTGSRYSSALGIMNQAVRENATEEVAARILSGTASRDEQVAVGEAIVARFGIDAWAPSTVEKCS